MQPLENRFTQRFLAAVNLLNAAYIKLVRHAVVFCERSFAMSISFVPSANSVLLCEYGPSPFQIPTSGIFRGPLAVAPEMWKVRPVVVISTSNGTSLVVPFSTDAPKDVRGYHYRIVAGAYPFFDQNTDSWAKADMMGVVSHKRLDRVLINGRYSKASLLPEDFRAIQCCVLDALNFSRLTSYV